MGLKSHGLAYSYIPQHLVNEEFFEAASTAKRKQYTWGVEKKSTLRRSDECAC